MTKLQEFVELYTSMKREEWDKVLTFQLGFHGPENLITYLHYLKAKVPKVTRDEPEPK